MSTSEPQPEPRRVRRPRIVAVGGGKGGVGKSAVTVNLAVALARRGKNCVLVDADLGGANLHTLVGLPSPRATLADLFVRNAGSLNEIVTPTGIPRLALISGARSLLDMANPKHAIKQKIIRQLFTLDADLVLIDLSAGASFNVIDFFLAAHDPVAVVVPTPTSIENAYHFLKAAFYRRLKWAIAEAGAAPLVDQALEEKVVRGIHSPRELIRHLQRTAPETGNRIADALAQLRPKLIVNQVRRDEELQLGPQIAAACLDYFGIEMEFLGGLRNDDRVVFSIQMKRPALEAYAYCPFSLALEGVAQRLLAATAEGR